MSLSIKRNDLSPAVATAITVGGLPVDLTGTSVEFFMTLLGASSPKVSASATVVGDPTLGNVQYTWAGTDTDTAGLYIAEFQVTFAGGIPRTFPENDYLYVNVVPDLGS